MNELLAYDDNGSGVPVLLVHAYPVHRGLWADVRGLLGPHIRFITPDMPGFGDSRPPAAAPSLDEYVDALLGLLDDLGVDKVVLGGVSMGGYISLAFARRHPDRLSGLLLADTKASADVPAAATNRRRIAAVLVAEDSPRVLLDELLPGLLGATTWAERPDVVARVRAMIEAVSPSSASWAQLAMAERAAAADVLASLRVPIAVIVGAEDAMTPVGDADAMVVVAADARLVTIPRAGHLSAIEAPAAFAAAVEALVARL